MPTVGTIRRRAVWLLLSGRGLVLHLAYGEAGGERPPLGSRGVEPFVPGSL